MTRTASSNSPLQRSSDRRRAGIPARIGRLAGACLLSLALPVLAPAQEQPQQVLRSPILVIDFDELFRLSERGQRVLQQFEAERRALAEEIAAIDAEMAAEEQSLTERRATLSPEEFRDLADAFDDKVQRLRAEQDDKAAALNRRQTEEQLRFRQAAAPVLGQLMLDTGALIVVEKRSLVVFNDAIDVTQITAERMDTAAPENDSGSPDAPPETAEDPAPGAGAED